MLPMVGEECVTTNSIITDSRLYLAQSGKTYNLQRAQMRNIGNNIKLERSTHIKTKYESEIQKKNQDKHRNYLKNL
jgi:hypothetical protein